MKNALEIMKAEEEEKKQLELQKDQEKTQVQ